MRGLGAGRAGTRSNWDPYNAQGLMRTARKTTAGLIPVNQPGRWNWFFFASLPDYYFLTTSYYFFAFLAGAFFAGFFAGALALAAFLGAAFLDFFAACLMAACAAASLATGTR